MLYSTLHKRWPRLVASVVGELIAAAALNLFIVPLGLYTGGMLGLCQLIRTLLQSALGLETGSYDIAGILYFITNIPILLLAYKTLGRELVVKTIVCAVSYSFFYSIIPIPSTPIIDDYLTACMLGGILTGVGSGIILDGKIVNGVNCAGGECGHMVIMVDGEQCSCGRKGCWEAYASATALIRQTKRAMDDYPDSIMHRLAEEEGGVNGKTAFDAMRLGDIAGIEVVNNYIKYVSCGLINLVNALQPEIICIGGGICNEGDTLMEPLRRYVQAERYSIHSKIQTQIVKAQLGNNAGIIGAALLYQVK